MSLPQSSEAISLRISMQPNSSMSIVQALLKLALNIFVVIQSSILNKRSRALYDTLE